ncbi:flagellar motor switch protein FliG [Granulicella rosea]|uniref:Flagellar motor switch protein FliG n=1 Tax=Granulicella rosea TaxID=474952 RepID=A0A239ELG5_9BACT|nr:flagellar motor switch protein FliG [Granulicella rosea]SNS44883.1 flagellar motor switch protein FliG [Granulicella rosea]
MTTMQMEGNSAQHLLPASAGFEAADMPGLRKAAILMIALGEELATTLFKSLSETEVQMVVDEITHLGNVPGAQMTQVLTEFYGLLETEQFVVRGGPDHALKLLTEAFGPGRAEEMLAQVKRVRDRSQGDLAMLQKMEPQQLSKFLEHEHPQTAALVLAHLDSKRGSTVLMQLNSSMRVDAVRRLAEMRQFSPEMAQKVALVLHRRMEALGGIVDKKSYAGYKAVAELLNGLNSVASKAILEEIEETEPQVAIEIRTLMFTFEDLLTIPQASVRELVGAVDKKVLATCLKGAKENLKAHLFMAMSSRAVEMLKEDIEVMGPVRAKDVGAAQQELLALARKLEEEGKIVLKMETDNDLEI